MNESKTFNLLVEQVAEFFSQKMRFTQDFALEVLELNEEKAVLKFAMQEKFQGNILQNILHGGATATVLDTASGMTAVVAACAKEKHASMEEQKARIAKTATIDLRIDYLRPGRGNYFIVTAEIVRCGNKIIVVDSTLHNDESSLLARGIGTYLVGH